MELYSVHTLVLVLVFGVALVMGAVMNKTNFCTMGAVSDWVNMGDTGRMRAWVLAMAVGITGVLLLEAFATPRIPPDAIPYYRTENFAWLRYIVGGFLFGIGMTLGSGCGSKTLLRVGTGNAKSLLTAGMIALVVYL
ncbi:MAG TPA: YeeE/YedE thiosulfate transporter family protein, partial [Burkholderiales bacterium]|nr:YeeE/YedE thiosulfate transporter family protein [Burkholderiales bacterium]